MARGRGVPAGGDDRGGRGAAAGGSTGSIAGSAAADDRGDGLVGGVGDGGKVCRALREATVRWLWGDTYGASLGGALAPEIVGDRVRHAGSDAQRAVHQTRGELVGRYAVTQGDRRGKRDERVV